MRKRTSRFGPGRKDGAVYLKLAPLLLAVVAFAVHGASTKKHHPGSSKHHRTVLLIGNQKIQPAPDQNRAGQAEAFAFVARATGRVTRARVYVARGSRAGRLVVGIYADAVRRGHGRIAQPGALVSSGSIGTPRAGRWNDVPLRSARLAKGLRYWIALLGVKGRLNFRDRRSGTMSMGSKQTGMVKLPRVFSPGAHFKSGPASVYVTGFAVKSPSGAPGSSAPNGAPPAPAPAPPASSAGCSGARNTPGGPDPWGGCFPGPQNTGVPPGTALTAIPGNASSGTGWSFANGTLTINTCGVTLNAVKVAGSVFLNSSATNGTSSSSTPCVTINNSEIDGWVDVGGTAGNLTGGPLVMHNDFVNVPPDDMDRSPVTSKNYWAYNINVVGGRLGFACWVGPCYIQDSWAHGGYLSSSPSGTFHYNALGIDGSDATSQHSVMSCDFSAAANSFQSGSGCSDDVGLFGDFNPISNITLNHNLFVSAPNPWDSIDGPPVCFDGNNPDSGKNYPNATNVSVTDNVFQKGKAGQCGIYGPVNHWSGGGSGDVFTGNVWDDGSPLRP